jgi:chromosome segregation ATPase
MDQELIDHLDRRFEEAKKPVEGLRKSVEDLRTEMDERFEEAKKSVEDLRREVVARFERVEDRVRQNGAMIEDLRDEVHAVAEGVVNVNGKLERFQVNGTKEFEEVRALHRLSHGELDRRVTRLETGRLPARHRRRQQ